LKMTNKMSKDNWRRVKVDPSKLKDNPYLKAPVGYEEPEDPIPQTENWIELNDIECRWGSYSSERFEKYDTLYVAKDVMREKESREIYKANTSDANKILNMSSPTFLPSFALTCNILVRLYELKEHRSAWEILKQYDQIETKHGKDYGIHAQNTVVDFKNTKIIHYPHATDDGHKPVEFDFSYWPMKDQTLDEILASHHGSVNMFVRMLTGLREPAQLIPISHYLRKRAKLDFPSDRKKIKSGKSDCRIGSIMGNLELEIGSDIPAAFRAVRAK